MGRTLLVVQQPLWAQRVLERAVRASPDTEAVASLAESLLLGGEVGIRRVEHLGLSWSWIGDPDAAHDVIRAGRDGGCGAARLDLVDAEVDIARHDFDAALRTLELLADDSRSSRPALATELVARDRRARLTGGYSIADAQRSAAIFSIIVDRTPGDVGTRQRAVQHLVQMGEFRRARSMAWDADPFLADASPPSADRIDELGDCRGLESWLYAVHAELATHGRFTDSHRFKRRIAEIDSRRTIDRNSPIAHLVSVVQATLYLDGAEAALEQLAARPTRFATNTERLTIEKLRADLLLRQGDRVATRNIRDRLAVHDVAAHDRFRQMVSGASVLVVGPAPGHQPDEQTLAAADVVVTTKRPLDAQRKGRGVVYVTDATGRLESERLERSLARDEDLLIVIRPSWLADPRAPVVVPGRVRVMQCEDSCTYLGTHFAIQRILYDLIGFDAGSITLAGVDFFLAPEPYREDYANEQPAIYGPRGLQPVRSLAPHDHRADFDFTKRLYEHDMIDAFGDVRRLLTLTPDRYLDRLTRNRTAASGGDRQPI